MEETRKIANVRIHVERANGSIRQKFCFFLRPIANCLLKVDGNGVCTFDEIVGVCCIIFNLCPSLISLGY